MRRRYVCRLDKEGKPRILPADSIMVHKQDESLLDFDTRMRRTLYRLECDEGSRFRIPGGDIKTMQRVWGSA